MAGGVRFRVGLTGGIASGKSAVADRLEALGAVVIDTDIVAREVVEPGQPALEEIRSAFGEDMLNDDGTLNRRALRQHVFRDAGEREKLESILHPRIRQETLRQAANADGPYQVIVVPLLTGSALREAMDRILVVDCATSTQLARLIERDAETPEQAKRMLKAQASREERLAIADDVIQNDGTLEELDRKVEALHERYLQLANPG